jgi:hypothetical protein
LTFFVPSTSYLPTSTFQRSQRMTPSAPELLQNCANFSHLSPFPPFFPVNVFYTKPIQKGTTFFAILIKSLGTFCNF